MRGLNHRQDAFVHVHPVLGLTRQVNEITRHLTILSVLCHRHQRLGVLQDLCNPLGVPRFGTALGVERRIEPIDHGRRLGHLFLGHAEDGLMMRFGSPHNAVFRQRGMERMLLGELVARPCGQPHIAGFPKLKPLSLQPRNGVELTGVYGHFEQGIRCCAFNQRHHLVGHVREQGISHSNFLHRKPKEGSLPSLGSRQIHFRILAGMPA